MSRSPSAPPFLSIPPLLLLVIALFFAASAGAAADTLTIGYVGDTHSHLSAGGARDGHLRGSTGGIARAATVIGRLRASEPNLLMLHSGDAFVGDLAFNVYFGVPELKLMRALGFDAMALGNHEFDLGPDLLAMALDSAFTDGSFPVLSANIRFGDAGDHRLRSLVDAVAVRDLGQSRVGIIGLTTPETNLLSSPAPLSFDEEVAPILISAIDSLRRSGCDLVILLSHLGIAADRQLAAGIEGIDVIIGGHDHILLERPESIVHPGGGSTLVCQAGAHYHNLGLLRLSIEPDGVRLLADSMIHLGVEVAEDPAVAAVVEQLEAGIEEMYGPVFSTAIAQAEADHDEVALHLLEEGTKDTPIGNLVSDAIRSETGADVAIVAGGSTAAPLLAGPVLPIDLFRVVGYGFNVVNGLGFRVATVDVTGAGLWAGLEFGLSSIEQNDEFLLQASGLRYSYDPHAPAGSRLTAVTIGGEALEIDRTYRVALNEFSVALLGVVGVPYSGLRIHDSTSEFQALAGYVAARQSLTPIVEGRIRALLPAAVTADRHGSRSVATPNPFRELSTITVVATPRRRHQATLHDALGRLVATLHDGMVESASLQLTVDGSTLPIGSYYCRIECEGDVEVVPLLRR